jgi:acetyl-CoA acyltransferase 1
MLNGQFEAQPTSMNARSITAKHDDDIVIVSMARTAMTRAKKGNQRNTAPEAMLAPVMRDVIKKSGIDAKLIEEICIGNVLQPGAGSTSSRMAQFLADIPDTTSLYAVDRLCSSGLQAVMNVAQQIASR